MQVIGNFEDWKAIGVEEQFNLPGTRTRPVTLDVNSAAAVAVYVCFEDDGSVNFLGRVCGRDKIRFVARGKTSLMIEAIDASMLYIHTRDGDVIHVEPTFKEAFTKYHERQPYDPRMLAFQEMMLANVTRLNEVVAEAKAAKEALIAERKRTDQASAPEATAAPAAASAGSDGGTGHAPAEQSAE